MSEVTLILNAVQAGEEGAPERLWRVVYGELRRLAAQKMAGESRQITLQSTALVHEAWLRLAGSDGRGPACENSAHFFTAAGEAMRRILVDQARQRMAAKRGGGCERRPLAAAWEQAVTEDDRVLRVHEALDGLAAKNAQQAQIVKLSFFVGLSQDEIAGLLGVSKRTVQRDWTVAKAWLFQAMRDAHDGRSAGQ